MADGSLMTLCQWENMRLNVKIIRKSCNTCKKSSENLWPMISFCDEDEVRECIPSSLVKEICAK